MATNCWLVNTAIFPFAGLIVMDDRTAGSIVTDVLPLIEPELAEIVREPRARATANPPPRIDSKVLLEAAQVTEPVISCVL